MVDAQTLTTRDVCVTRYVASRLCGLAAKTLMLILLPTLVTWRELLLFTASERNPHCLYKGHAYVTRGSLTFPTLPPAFPVIQKLGLINRLVLPARCEFLVHGQVTIIFVVSVGLSVCLCRVFLSHL